jgi:hypothetical protein
MAMQETERNNPEANQNLLYRGDKFEIRLQTPPQIPLNEGLSVVICDAEGVEPSPRNTLNKLLMAEMVAKAIAAGPFSPMEPWANVWIEEDGTVRVFGLRADADTWGQPVDNHRPIAETKQVDPELVRNLREYFNGTKRHPSVARKWEKLATNMSLFTETFPDSEIGHDTNEQLGHGVLIFQTIHYDVVFHDVRKVGVDKDRSGNIRGGNYGHTDIHFVISPNGKSGYRQQWQTESQAKVNVTRDQADFLFLPHGEEVQPELARTLELGAISLCLQELFGGVIQINNNWSPDLALVSEGGKVDLEEMKKNPYSTKRQQRNGLLKTSVHAQLYANFDNSPVLLPQMKREKAQAILDNPKSSEEKCRTAQIAIDRWGAVPVRINNYLQARGISMDQFVDEIRDKIGNGNLNKLLEEKMAGLLVG